MHLQFHNNHKPMNKHAIIDILQALLLGGAGGYWKFQQIQVIHELTYLQKLMPAMGTAGLCALVGWLIREFCNFVKGEFLKWRKRRHKDPE